jgi:hypothetical protein
VKIRTAHQAAESAGIFVEIHSLVYRITNAERPKPMEEDGRHPVKIQVHNHRADLDASSVRQSQTEVRRCPCDHNGNVFSLAAPFAKNLRPRCCLGTLFQPMLDVGYGWLA